MKTEAGFVLVACGAFSVAVSSSGKNYYERFGDGVFASGRRDGSNGAFAVTVSFEKDLSKLFEQAGLRSVYATAKAIDEVGNKTKTQVIRAVAKQAGVKVGKVRSVISSRQAMGGGNGQYEIIARDVTLSLKEFAPRATKKGVSAAPWGERRVFPHTFIGPNGHVFVRAIAQGPNRNGTAGYRVKRLPIHKLFGPALPKEMIKDEAEKTFFRVSEDLLGPAVEKWLLREIVKAGQ